MTARRDLIAWVMLAAGASARMGRPKLLLPYGSGTLLSSAAREVVRRHWSEAVRVPAPPLADVDTEEDYRGILEGWARRAEGLKLP